MKFDVQKIVFPAVNEVGLETGPQEFSLGTEDVLIRTQYSVISAGTELAKLTGLQTVAYPFIPGNRAVGEVIAIGSAVNDLRPGDRVFSHTPHVSHALTTRFHTPVPADVDSCTASLIGMALVAITALRIGQVELGDVVVVTGLGLVGNLAAQLLQLAGAQVIAVDPVPGRLDIASACGVETLINPAEVDLQSAVMDLTRGKGADVVVEASGLPEVAETALSLTGHSGEGVVVLLGSPRRDYEVNLTPVLNRMHLWRGGSVTVRGAHEWRYPLQQTAFAKHSMQRNASAIFRLMAQQKLHTQPLLTQIFSPDEAAEAFDGLRSQPDAYMGVVFNWTSGGAQGT